MSTFQRDAYAATAGGKCPQAFDNLDAAIDFAKRLPSNVFKRGWTDFHLFDSDWIFEGDFVDKVLAMLQREDASCACIVHLGRDARTDTSRFVVECDTTAEDYQRILAGAGPGDGWVYDIDRFCSTSDRGTWCIYCERASELAVIGFRAGTPLAAYELPLASLRAREVAAVGSKPNRYQFLPHVISPEWQTEISRNYGVPSL